MFRVNQNITAINARRQLGVTDREVNKTVQKLSSGLRINHAADDAAGLFVSETMRSQIAGLKQANLNAHNAISLLQTAEGGMAELNKMLVRLKELAEQSADGAYNNQNRAAIQREVDAIIQEYDRITYATRFNTMTLLDGTTFTFQIGEDGSSISRIAITLGSIASGVMIPSVISAQWGSQASALQVIASIDIGINSLSAVRTGLGAFQNRLERALSNLEVQIENTTRAESVIRDADFAAETASLTRAMILVQSGTSVLNQANLLPQNALTLLQGLG